MIRVMIELEPILNLFFCMGVDVKLVVVSLCLDSPFNIVRPFSKYVCSY